MVMFKVNDRLIAEKFSRLPCEECEPFPVFAYYTLAFALQLKEKARENLSQGSRKVPGGHDSMCRHGRLLGVARTCCRSRSTCFRGPGSTLGQPRSLSSCV